MKLCLYKITKSDAHIRPFFANSVTYVFVIFYINVCKKKNIYMSSDALCLKSQKKNYGQDVVIIMILVDTARLQMI